MVDLLLHSTVTLLDLLALCSFFGGVWCLLWLRLPGGGDGGEGLLSGRVRRLLLVCLAALVVSSLGDLLQRGVEMSGAGVSQALSVLPTIVLKTHYGEMWFVRMAGLLLGWTGWLLGRRAQPSLPAVLLLFSSGLAIAFSRSASGHAADFGDMSGQQISDFLHLLAAASWGGSLMALALTLPSGRPEGQAQGGIPAIAERYYLLFGPALAVLVFTGLYNAWTEGVRLGSLWAIPYGGVLAAKLLLFILLVLRYVAPPERGRDEAGFPGRFIRRTRPEAVAMAGLLLAAAMLTHSVPARHAAHLMHAPAHGHHDMNDMGQGR